MMCTRYGIDDTNAAPELEALVEEAASSGLTGRLVDALGRPLKTSGEVRPTNLAPVVATSRTDLSPRCFPMVWGFASPWSKAPLVNARVESAASKPFWHDAWQGRRCAIPASWYFEWEHRESSTSKGRRTQKYRIQPTEGAMLFLAGLYQFEQRGDLSVPVFAVLTREPAESIRFIHDRMPLMLPPDAVASWINPRSGANELDIIVSSALTDVQYCKAES